MIRYLNATIKSQENFMGKMRSFDSLQDNANKVLNAVAEDAAPEACKRGSRVSDTIATAASAIAKAGANAGDTVKIAAASADEFVRESPWIAIGLTAGIAGAVGFLAGLMAAPKMRF